MQSLKLARDDLLKVVDLELVELSKRRVEVSLIIGLSKPQSTAQRSWRGSERSERL